MAVASSKRAADSAPMLVYQQRLVPLLVATVALSTSMYVQILKADNRQS
jgi:hypothetical protein